MKTPWQVIQRQNKSALLTGAATHAIPEYVTPSINVFRADMITGQVKVPAAEHAVGPIPLTVYFLLVLNDPDGLATGIIFDNGYDAPVTLTLADLPMVGTGYLIASTYTTIGEYSPDVQLIWSDPDGTSATLSERTLDNPPVETTPQLWAVTAAELTPDYLMTVPGIEVPCSWSVTIYVQDDWSYLDAEGDEN